MWEPHDFRMIFGTTKIEYDENKEEKNRKNHKYSLSCAADIFEEILLLQPNKMITSDSFNENGEIRHMHLAEYQNKTVLFVTTMRDNETIRIISMHDADEKYREIYRQNPPQS
jgi:uncharacterized DUF497 family protein